MCNENILAHPFLVCGITGPPIFGQDVLCTYVRVWTLQVLSCLYHMWENFGWEKLANLVNRMSFANFLSVSYFFLQSIVAIHVAHSPIFYPSNWLGLAHLPTFYPAKTFPCTASSYIQCNNMACVFMCLGAQKNNSINFINSRHNIWN